MMSSLNVLNLVLVLSALIPLTAIYKFYLRLPLVVCIGVALFTLPAGYSCAYLHYEYILSGASFSDRPDWVRALSDQQQRRMSLFAALTVLFALPLLIKLIQKWFFAELTPVEQTPSQAFSAWFGPGNLIMVLGTAICLSQALLWNFWPTLLSGLFLLAIHPLIITLRSTPEDEDPLAQPSEKQRVLRMVEAGTISPDEGSELISALGRKPDSLGAMFSRTAKFKIAGAVTVAVSFFLPWFVVDVGEEMQRLGQQFNQQSFQQAGFPSGLATELNFANNPITGVFSGMELEVRGGDIDGGLGWLVRLSPSASRFWEHFLRIARTT